MKAGNFLQHLSDQHIIGILVHILIGILIGYFILHPFSMVIYWFEMNPAGISSGQIFKIVQQRLMYAFHFDMTPMGFSFSIIGGLFGLVSGLYYRSLKRMKIENLKRKQFLELEKVKTEFLQMLSHEVRTPLNGIVGSLYMIKNTIVSEDLNEVVDMLDQSVSRLENFSLYALRITELQTKSKNISKESINIVRVVEGIVSDFSEKIHEKELVVESSHDDKPFLVTGNENLIKICLSNLLDNAIKFSKKEGKITIHVQREGPTVTCDIIDEGQGFTKESLKTLFQLFGSADRHVDKRTGLVFPLLKLIMEAHGGKIEVGNMKHGGARVRLVFKRNE